MLEAFLIVFGETVVCRLDNSCFFSSAQTQAPAAQVQTVTAKPELEIPKEITISVPMESKENESK